MQRLDLQMHTGFLSCHTIHKFYAVRGAEQLHPLGYGDRSYMYQRINKRRFRAIKLLDDREILDSIQQSPEQVQPLSVSVEQTTDTIITLYYEPSHVPFLVYGQTTDSIQTECTRRGILWISPQ